MKIENRITVTELVRALRAALLVRLPRPPHDPEDGK